MPIEIWNSRLRSGLRLRSGSAHCDLALAVHDVAVPTELWSSRLRSGSAYWDLGLAVEEAEVELHCDKI